MSNVVDYLEQLDRAQGALAGACEELRTAGEALSHVSDPALAAHRTVVLNLQRRLLLLAQGAGLLIEQVIYARKDAERAPS